MRNVFQPSCRHATPRRFASGEMPKLTGAADNAFNRERMAVKQHAAASSGTDTLFQTIFHSLLIHTLTRTQISGANYRSSDCLYRHPYLHWLNSYSVCIPALILAAINAKNLWDEHWEHWEHLPPLEDRVEYPYMNIRTKKYFWGDGDKVIRFSVRGPLKWLVLTMI